MKPSEVKDIEMNVLSQIYKDNLREFNNGLKIFDSTSFLNELKNLENYGFKSKEAQDFLKYTQDFHTLFNQDARIASSIYEPKASSSSSTLATSISGAMKVKTINILMDSFMRNLSVPFWMKGGRTDQQASKSALKYQISKALEQSRGLSDFKRVF